MPDDELTRAFGHPMTARFAGRIEAAINADPVIRMHRFEPQLPVKLMLSKLHSHSSVLAVCVLMQTALLRICDECSTLRFLLDGGVCLQMYFSCDNVAY